MSTMSRAGPSERGCGLRIVASSTPTLRPRKKFRKVVSKALDSAVIMQ